MPGLLQALPGVLAAQVSSALPALVAAHVSPTPAPAVTIDVPEDKPTVPALPKGPPPLPTIPEPPMVTAARATIAEFEATKAGAK